MIVQAFFQMLSMHLLRLWKMYIVGGILFFILGVLILSAPPSTFPVTRTVTIVPGTTVTGTARLLAREHIIRSPLLFRLIVDLLPAGQGVQSGMYLFEKPVSVFRVAWNSTHAITGLHALRLTFPEGTTVRGVNAQLVRALPTFDGEQFTALALPQEGYLFPDTYFFSPNTTPREVVELMRTNFDTHTNWKKGIELSESKVHDAVILASILEAEGKTLEDKQIIAGILLKRLRLDMPLQVDATFGYAYGRTGYVPTRVDIEGDSPYNSYRMHGLPPTPINNPGEVSLHAAVTPAQTPYLYYLTGSDGLMHYASTFAQHIDNQKKYFK